MLKIGDLKLSSNLILAPMAGVSDLPFRLLNHKFGCNLGFVEMINARCLGYKNKKTRSMLSTAEEDKPLGVQLLGCEEDFIKKAMEVLPRFKFDVLDFNAACPERKVVRRGEGASLLKDPAKLNKLLKIVVRASPVPVTVKIRAGWDKDSINARDVGLYCQDAGVKALFIHGRTKTQEYSGSVDYKVIADVKKHLKIPVIGSGDVFSAELAKKMFDETGCDGVLLARGSLGNPWIFKEIRYLLKYGKSPARPDKGEIIRTMLEHLGLSVDFHGPRVGVVSFRKFFIWYTSGFRAIRPLREKICRAKTKEEAESLIHQISVS